MFAGRGGFDFKVVSIPRFAQLSEAKRRRAKLIVTALLLLFGPIQGPRQGPWPSSVVVEIVGGKNQARDQIGGAAPL